MSDPLIESLEILGTPEFSKLLKGTRETQETKVKRGKMGAKGRKEMKGTRGKTIRHHQTCSWHNKTPPDRTKNAPDTTRHVHHLRCITADVILFPMIYTMWGLTWFWDELKARNEILKRWRTYKQTNRISTWRLHPSGRRCRVNKKTGRNKSKVCFFYVCLLHFLNLPRVLKAKQLHCIDDP